MMCSLIFLLMRAAPNLLPAILSLIIVSCHLETQAWVNSLGVQRAYGDPLLVAEHRPVDCPGDSVLGKLERRPHIDDLVEAGDPGHLVLLQGVVRQPDSELLVVVVVPATTAICLLISVINMLEPRGIITIFWRHAAYCALFSKVHDGNSDLDRKSVV